MKTLSKELLAICDIASSNDVRPVIAGIKITEDKIVATDSYKLVEFTREKTPDISEFPRIDNVDLVEHLDDDGVIIRAKNIKKYVKLFKDQTLPVLNCAALANKTDNSVSIVSTNLEVSQENRFNLIQGKYPLYEQIIPKGEPKSRVCVNLVYLKQICEAFIKAGCVEGFIETRGQREPLIIKGDYAKTEGRKIGLIMPLKSEFKDGGDERKTKEIK